MEPQWTSEPWKGRPKCIKQRLFDLGLELPAIYRQASETVAIKDPALALANRLKVIEECVELNRRFDSWYEELRKEIPGPLYHSRFSTMTTLADDEEHGKVFPIAYEFPSLRIAHTTAMYWSLSSVLHGILLMVLGALQPSAQESYLGPSGQRHACANHKDAARCDCESKAPGPSPGAEVPNLSSLPSWEDSVRICESAAANVCQSIEYYLRDESGTIGSAWAIFPLRAVMQFYHRRGGRELQWCAAVFQKLSEGKGLEFSRHISQGGWD